MNRIGATPAWGIDHEEEGLFVSSIDFTPSCEEYEQVNAKGEISGLYFYKQKIEVSMTGEVPFGSQSVFAIGTSLEMANKPDDELWMDKPAATTVVVKPSAYNMRRESAQERTITAVIYPFGTAAQQPAQQTA